MTRQEASSFYQAHSKAVYNTALRILRDSAQAEEVMQDTLLKYLSGGVKSASDAQAAAWLRTTCVRKSIDRLRAIRRGQVFMDTSLLPAEDEPLDEPLDGPFPDILQIRMAMETLPEPYRLILDLTLIEGLGYDEIARMTRRKESTLRSIYARGKARLAAKLRQLATADDTLI